MTSFSNYPQSNCSMAESIPTELVSASWRNRLLVHGIGVASFCSVLIVIGAEHGWAAFIVIWFAFTSGMVFAATLTYIKHYLVKIHLPVQVEMQSGQLKVHWGDRTETAKLSDCRLTWGRVYQMHLPGMGNLYCFVQVILIEPPRRSRWEKPMRVAVGYSDDLRQKWEQAITGSVDTLPRK